MSDRTFDFGLSSFLESVEKVEREFDFPPVRLSAIVDYHCRLLDDSSNLTLERRAATDFELRYRLMDVWREIAAIQSQPSLLLTLSPFEDPFRFEVGRLLRIRKGAAFANIPSVPAPTESSWVGGDAGPPPTFMVGRDEELRAVLRRLETERLVSVVAQGGVGKSTLLREIASTSSALLGLAVLSLECGSLASVDDFVEALAVAVGIPGEGRDAVALRLRKVGLLVLDQMDEDAFALSAIAFLRELELETRILVARRSPLDLPGESVFALLPLGLEDAPKGNSNAVQLFINTAQRMFQDFKLNANSRRLVRDICHLALGVPLSITMAAASMNHQSLDETLNQLRVTSGVSQRPDSLRATVAHSFQVLSQSNRASLCRLSNFAGRFSFEDAQFVSGASERELSASLVQLHHAGLLSGSVQGDGGNYMLHALAKEYSSTLLALPEWQAEAKPSADRYQVLFAERAREIGDQMSQGRWTSGIQALSRNNADLRQAMRRSVAQGDRTGIRDFAIGLSRTYFETGRLSDFEIIADAALGLEENSLTVRILGLKGAFASLNGETAECGELWERRRALCEEIGDVAGVADCLSDLAWESYEQGDIPRATEFLDEAERLSIEASLWELAASMQVIRARILVESGQTEEARAAVGVCLETLTRCRDKSLLPFVYQELAGVYRRLGEEEQALASLKTLLSIAAEGERAIHAGRSLLALASVYEARGEVDTAAVCYFAASNVLNEYQTKDRRKVEAEMEAFVARYPEREEVLRMNRNTPWQEVVASLLA